MLEPGLLVGDHHREHPEPAPVDLELELVADPAAEELAAHRPLLLARHREAPGILHHELQVRADPAGVEDPCGLELLAQRLRPRRGRGVRGIGQERLDQGPRLGGQRHPGGLPEGLLAQGPAAIRVPQVGQRDHGRGARRAQRREREAGPGHPQPVQGVDHPGVEALDDVHQPQRHAAGDDAVAHRVQHRQVVAGGVRDERGGRRGDAQPVGAVRERSQPSRLDERQRPGGAGTGGDSEHPCPGQRDHARSLEPRGAGWTCGPRRLPSPL